MNSEAASNHPGDTERARRNSRERLDAVLGRKGEALSPRALRKLLEQLLAVIDTRIGEVEGGGVHAR